MKEQSQQPRGRRAGVRTWRNLAVALGLIVTILAIGIAVFDWNWLKGPIEQAVTSATGRRFEIGGNVVGQWRLSPRIGFESVRFANPDWAQVPHLVTAERMEIQIALLPLFSRRVHLIDLVLVKPAVALERMADGRATWLFDKAQRDPESAPRIDSLRVDTGSLDYRDALNRAELKIGIDDDSDRNRPGSLHFTIKGRFRGEGVDLRGWSPSLLELRDAHRALPVFVQGTIAQTRIELQGTTADLPNLEHLNLRYRVQGASLKRLAPLFHAPLPDTPPYDVRGRLVRSDQRWETSDMQGRVGNSDLAGRVVVTTGKSKPELEARLTSRLLDLADLGPLIGTRSADAPRTDTNRVLPNRTFDLSRVSSLDADVQLSAQRVVRAANFPFDNFHAAFKLKDSQITIDPLQFGMADGTLRARVGMDARNPPLVTTVSGRIRDLRVAKIFPEKGALGEAAGSLAGTFDLRGRGNSVSLMLGSASGRATLLLADGRVPNLMPALADLDGARIISSLIGKRPEFVHCAAIALDLQSGVATPSVAVFETESTVLHVTGSIDLREERLDLRLAQAPKKVSFLSARTPILISGRLNSPVLSPDVGPLTARTAAAVVLGLINPLAALFATIEPGPGEDGTCPEIRRGIPRQYPSREGSVVPGKSAGSGLS